MAHTQVVVVTGGTQGLGAAAALRIAEQGAKAVVLCGRSKDKGEAVAEQIRSSTDTRAHFVAADLGDEEATRNVVKTADKCGGV